MTRNGQRLLLLIDDEPARRRLVSALAARAGWRTLFVADTAAAGAVLDTPEGAELDAVLVDPRESGEGGAVAAVAALRAARAGLPVLVLATDNDVPLAVEAMRAGAADFLVKPLSAERLAAALAGAVADTAAGELRPLAEKIPALLSFAEIVGTAPEFRTALAVAARAARGRVPVLIEGERGVGKALVAEAVHAASTRAGKPLVTVRCAGLAPNLAESELFGHEEGAFPGAFERKPGRFADADGGTVFLDDVDALPPDVQAKLARALADSQVRAMGAGRARAVDVRVIAASDVALADEVEAGRFREDLFFRLNAVTVTIPPLRQRAGDVPALTRHLLGRIAQQPGLRPLGITDDAVQLLAGYHWPGNVRQLQDALFRAAVLCDGDGLTRGDFPRIAAAARSSGAGNRTPARAEAGGVSLYGPDGHLRALDDIEADVIRLAIGHYRGRMTEVARRLRIGRSTLYRKLGELGIHDAA